MSPNQSNAVSPPACTELHQDLVAAHGALLHVLARGFVRETRRAEE